MHKKYALKKNIQKASKKTYLNKNNCSLFPCCKRKEIIPWWNGTGVGEVGAGLFLKHTSVY